MRFDTIDDREEKIEEAHADTFNWILSDRERGSAEVGESSSIVPWLAKDDKAICWVSGKAGSGKSTLMKYIWRDERTRTHLSTWAGDKELVRAAFFFYERGTSLQKSRMGLIQSLLYQILSQQRRLIPIVFKDEFELLEAGILTRRFMLWDNLKNAFEILLTHTSNLFKFCIFADGLDEYRIMDRMGDYTDKDFDLFYDGENDDEEVWGRSHWIGNGHREVAELFKVAAKTTNVKICLSSRELTPFQRAFEGFPRLRLHDLTTMDITIFTNTHILRDIESTPTADETKDMNSLAKEIVLKAQGVFLWVRLVVDILVMGFNNGDTIPELQVKLDSLPPRLGGKKGLYVAILKNINPEYRLQASRYIRLLLNAWNDLDLVDLEFAADGPFEKNCLSNVNSENISDKLIAVKAPFKLVPDGQLEPRRKKMRLRLMSRCGGLLEAPNKHVRFMHQTVKEFFLRDELWIHLLPQESQSSFDPRLALLSACVLRLKCLEELISQAIPDLSFGLDYIYIADSLHYAASSEDHGANKNAYFRLLDELDLTCAKLARTFVARHRIQPELVDGYHWSRFEPMESGTTDCSKDDSFLSLAVQAGLASYVASKLSGGVIPVGATFGKPLLAYAVSFHFSRIPMLVFIRARNYDSVRYSLPDLRVVAVLLSFGADTNAQWGGTWGGTTVWKDAVQTGYRIFDQLSSLHAQGVPAVARRSRNERRWVELMKILLRNGANPDELCFTREAAPRIGYRNMPAREVIRLTLEDNFEYRKDLEEIETIFKERVPTA